MEFDQAADGKVIKIKDRAFKIRIWKADGKMMPLTDTMLAVDTETHLITDHTVPSGVIAQVCNGSTVDLIGWEDFDAYFGQLALLMPDKILFVFFNASYDLAVLQQPYLYGQLEKDNVIDLAARYCLLGIAEEGYYKHPVSLGSLCKQKLLYNLPKPEDIRLTFRREKMLTVGHCVYGAMDPAATYLLAERMEKQPTEALQTRGIVALDAIQRNGMLIDREYFDSRRGELLDRKLVLEEALNARGYNTNPNATVLDVADAALVAAGLTQRFGKTPSINQAKAFFYYTMAALNEQGPAFVRVLSAHVDGIISKHPDYTSTKIVKETNAVMEDLCRSCLMEELIGCRKSKPFVMLSKLLIENKMAGRSIADILAKAREQYDRHRGWLDPAQEIGPQLFVQQHLAYLEQHEGLHFDRTDGGLLKASKADAWKLKVKGIEDPFLDEYFEYKHIEKLLSTYLNDEHIGPDGRVHPRFNVMVRTGRTSCSEPNLQNVPKADKLREIYVAPPDHVLAAIDYSQLELYTLAQHCYKVLGKSRLREYLNAGLDVHCLLAGRKLGIVTDDNDYDGTEESRKKLKALLDTIKIEYRKPRQHAKEGNFGFPGGLGEERFLSGCQAKGMIDMTIKDAEQLKEMWFKTFPEMKEYMRPTACPSLAGSNQQMYQAVTLTGRLRRYCSFNSACNYPFQGLAADGAKVALWQLYKAGFKVVNFIHDEVIVELPEDSAVEQLAVIEKIMADAMCEILPDMSRIKTESALMRRWYKEAEAVYDQSGKLTVWEPKEK